MQLLLGRRGKSSRGERLTPPPLTCWHSCGSVRRSGTFHQHAGWPSFPLILLVPVCQADLEELEAACQRLSASASVCLSGAAKHHFPLFFLFSGSGKNRRQSMLF